MEQSKSDLSNLIAFFYRKVTQNHDQNQVLLAKFEKFINFYENDGCKPHQRYTQKTTNGIQTRKDNQKNKLSEPSIYCQYQLKQQDLQNMYSSPFFNQILTYSYISYLIENEAAQKFRMIHNRLQLLCQKVKKEKKEKNEKKTGLNEQCLFLWRKVVQKMENSITSKQILKNMFLSFDQNFFDLLTFAIFGFGWTHQIAPTRSSIIKISRQLKLSIKYIQIDFNGKNQIQVGLFNQTLVFIHFRQKNIFHTLFQDNPFRQFKSTLSKATSAQALVERPLDSFLSPQKSQIDKKQSKLNNRSLKSLACRKAIRTIQFLVKEYDRNNLKLKDLGCLKYKNQDQKQPIFNQNE